MKNGMVIVNYNDYITTKRLIDNIHNYKCLDKIVIVDNKSSDDSLTKLKKLQNNKIIVIESEDNKGYSSGLNIGCKYLIDLYKECKIIISNSDIIIDSEDDLIILLNTLNNSNVVVAPTIIEHNDVNRGWIIPKCMDEVIINLPIIGKNYQKNHLLYTDKYYNKNLSKVDAVSGCFFLINSKHLESINYFDENVFLYYEENILAVKTKVLKKNIVVVNNIDVIHDHAVSIDKSLKRLKKYDILKKSQYYFEKEYNNANIFNLFLLRISVWFTRIFLIFKYLFD